MADQITVNSADVIRAREGLFELFGGIDAKRPDAWTTYGYKTNLTFADFRQAYRRGGAGHGAVHCLLDKCWETVPRIKQPNADKSTPWEEEIGRQLKKINGWQKLRDLDRRNMVGRYSALIYRVADGLALREPMLKGRELVDLIPLYEDQIKVTAWHSDTADAENYGKPAMFQYRQRSPSSTVDAQAKPEDWADVHPSRVQMLAEGSVGDFFEGVPLLEPGFNALVDIEKLTGGGAEAALKNSSRTIVVEFDKDASPQVITANPDGTASTKSVKDVIEGQTKAMNRNQDASMVLQGAKATTLQTTPSDLSPQFDIAANVFSASVQIPMTILFGAQTGRLASDQDQKDMNARCESRRTNELTPMLNEFVARMQAAGIFEVGEFEIEWQKLGAPGDTEKMDLLTKMAAAMKQAFDAGLTEPLFDANELRKVAGYEPRIEDGMPSEEDRRREEDDAAAKAVPKPAAK